jgi:asparagine synthase (glutamine-hydrolysing)
MSGVFGCWHLDARPLDTASFHRSVARISPHGSHGIATWTDAAIGLGCKGSTTPLASQAGARLPASSRAVCTFDGRLDNRDELLRSLTNDLALGADCEDRDLVLAAYDRYGEAFVTHLRGDFIVAIFDRRVDRLLLARDPMGLRPLCYTQAGDTFLFSSEAKVLLANPGVPAKPDEMRLADFVLYFPSTDPQTRTFFQGIQSVPPAHLLIVTRAGVTLRRYFEFDTARQLRLPAFRDYADAFHELFVAAVRSRLRSTRPVAVSVSGGLDSTYIFCVAQRLVRSGAGSCPAVLGFNYAGAPGAASDEREFVDAIERACDAKIERIAQRPGFMHWAGDEAWSSESPMVEGLAGQAQAVLRRVREAGAGRFLTGHWGDQMLSDSDYLVDLLRSGRWPSLKRHSRGWGMRARPLAVRVLRDLASRHLPASLMPALRRARRRRDGAWEFPWYTPRFRQLLRERGAGAKGTSVAGTSHARAMYRQSRLDYHVQCMEWNNRIGAMHGLDVAFPYLDCDLIQFLMSIPGDVQSHDGVPRGLMREAMRGIVPAAIVDRRTKGEFTHLANESIEHDFPAISEILGPKALSVQFGYVDGPVLWSHLDQWRRAIRTSTNSELSNRVVELCGLELFLGRFFGEGGDTAAPQSQLALTAW